MFNAVHRMRRQLGHVQHTLMATLLGICFFLSPVANINSVAVMLFNDYMVKHTWLCKLLLIAHKLFVVYGPLTVFLTSIWISLQFIYPLRSKVWCETSTIRRSYVFLWIYLCIVYGIPAASDPNIAQCQQSVTFPNMYHGIAMLYTLLVPCVMMHVAMFIIVYRKARVLARNHGQRQNDEQQKRMLRNMTRTFTVVCTVTCLKVIGALLFVHTVIYCERCFENDWLFHILCTSFMNLHLTCLPVCLCRSKSMMAIVKAAVLKDTMRISKCMKRKRDSNSMSGSFHSKSSQTKYSRST